MGSLECRFYIRFIVIKGGQCNWIAFLTLCILNGSPDTSVVREDFE